MRPAHARGCLTYANHWALLQVEGFGVVDASNRGMLMEMLPDDHGGYVGKKVLRQIKVDAVLSGERARC